MASTWTGASNDNWNDAGNWSPSGVPGAGDTITIPATTRSGRQPEVLDGATATVSADLTNDETITLASTGDNTNFVVDGSVTLSGSGVLLLTDSADNRIYAGQGSTVLDNQETIKGAGQIFGGSLSIVNDTTGVIDATGANRLDVYSIDVENLGLLESTAGAGGLEIDDAIVDNDVQTVDSGRIVAAGADVLIGSSTDIIGGTLSSTAATSIDVIGKSSTLDGSQAAAIDITAGSVIAIENGENLTLDGVIDNDGQIKLADTQVADTDLVFNGVATLKGTGAVVMADDGTANASRIYSVVGGSSLDNQETIEGAGEIFSNNNLTLINDVSGVVDATGAHALDIHDITVENLNLLEGGGAGGLEIGAATIDNTDDGQTNSGEIAANNGDVLLNGADKIIGGTLASAKGRQIEVLAQNSTLVGSKTAPVTITANSVVAIENQENLTLNGLIENEGLIELADTKVADTDLIVNGAVTLAGGGEIVMADDGTVNASRIYSTEGGSTLDNQQTIEGAGEIFSNNNLTITNDTTGVVDATGANALDLHDITVENINLLEATGAGGLEIAQATIDNTDGGTLDSGRVVANGGNVLIQGAADIIGGGVSSNSGGEIKVASTGSVFDGSEGAAFDITKGSVVVLENAENLTLAGDIDNAGQIQLAATAANDTDLIIRGAVTLEGAGDVVMSDAGGANYNRIYATTGDSVLHNQQTIEGAGEIFSNNNLTFDNDATGVVDATGANVLAVHDITFNNTNLLETTGGAGGLSLYNATIDDIIDDADGEILADGAGTHVDIANTVIDGGEILSEAGGVINVVAGSAATLNGANTGDPIDLAVGSTVSILNGAKLTLEGVIENGGQLQLNAASASDTDLIANGAVTLEGAGALVMSDKGVSGYNRIYATVGGSTLSNQQTIEGAGEIFSNNNLTFDNDATGVVDANGANALSVHDITFNNANLLETTAKTGGLSISNATINNLFDDSVGEMLASGAGTHIDLANTTIVGGDLVSENGGAVDTTEGSSDTFEGGAAAAPFEISAGLVVSVLNGAKLTLTGTIKNDGQILLDATAESATDLIVDGGVTLEGGGAVVMSDAGAVGYNRIYSVVGGSTLDNQQTIKGAGEIFSNNNLTFDNDATGVVDATGAKALAVHDITFNNANLLETTGGAGGLSIYNATINNLANTDAGEILADGANVTLQNSEIEGGKLVSEAGGVIDLLTGDNNTFDGANTGAPIDITAGSVVSMGNGAELIVEGVIQNDGQLQLNATSASDTDLLVSGGVTWQGSGAVVLSDVGTIGTNRIYSDTGGSSLDNKETIEGAGEIFSNNNLSLLNDTTGIIDADGANALDIHDISFTNDGVVRAENGATLQIVDALNNISVDANYADGSVLTGGTYDLIDQVTGGKSPGGASTIAISGNGANAITTLDATVSLAGLPSELTSNNVSLVNSLREIWGGGVLNLYFGFNSGFAQNFDDPNAVKIDEGGMVFDSGAAFSTAGLTIESGGVLHAEGVFSGADTKTAAVGGPITNDGEILVDGAQPAAAPPAALFTGPVSGTGEIAINQDALAEFANGVGAGQTVTFGDNQSPTGGDAAGQETLRVDATNVAANGADAGDFAATIAGFGVGDVIDLANFQGEENYSFDGRALAVNFENGQTATIDFAGLGADAGFQFASDGDGGTLITTGLGAELANDTGASSNDGVTDDAALTGVGDAGATLTFREGGASRGTTVVGSNGTWSFTPTGLTDGLQTIEVDEAVAGGGSASTSIRFALATQKPVNKDPTESVSGLTNKTSDTFSVTPGAEDVSGDSLASVEIVDPSTGAMTTAAVGANGTYSATLNGLSDGAHVFDIVTTDAAGNSTTTALPEVYVATVAPTVDATGSLSGITAQTTDVITGAATAEDVPGDGISSVQIVDQDGDVVADATVNGGAFSATLSGLADGAHDFTVVVSDTAGNVAKAALSEVDVATQRPLNAAPAESVSGLTRQTSETISVAPTVESVPGNAVASVLIIDQSTHAETSATVGANGVYTATLSGLGDGAHVFDIVTTDTAGNSTTTALPEVDIATKAPTVDANESVSGTTTATSDVITATAAAESVPGNSIASVLVYDGSTKLGAATLSEGSWTYTAADLSLGEHDFSLVTTDSAGNPTTTKLAPVDVVSANTPPAVSVSESQSGLTRVASDTITEIATAAEGLTIAGVEVFDGGTDLGAAAYDAASGTWSLTAQNLSDGAHDFSTVTTDSAGNATRTTLTTLDVATQQPVVSASQSLSGLTNRNVDVISETAAAEALSGNAIKSVEVFDGAQDLGAAIFSAGVWSFVTASLPDGANQVRTLTTDAAGNVTTTPFVVLHVATKAPVVKASESVSGLTKQDVVTISGSAKAEAVAGDAILSVDVFDGATRLGAATLSGSGYSFNTSPLADGVHTFSVVTTDAAGNVTTTALAPIDIATQAPTVAASQSLSGLTNESIDVIDETASAESVASNAIQSVEIFDGAKDLGAATLSGGAWTFMTGTLPDGANLLRSVTTDAAGNVTVTPLAAIHIATKAPTVKALESVSGLTDQDVVTVSGTAKAQAVVGDAIASVDVFDGATDLGAATLAGSAWSFVTPVLADGEHELRVVTTDAAGNVTNTTLAPLDVATAPPSVVASQSLQGLTDDNMDTITEAATAEAVGANTIKSVEVYDGVNDLGAATFSQGSWTFTTGVLPDGANGLRTVTTDAAGNVKTTSLGVIHVATKTPVVNASESASSLTEQRNITITETARAETVAGDAIASVEMFDGATDLGAATFSNGAWMFTTPQLDFGVHNFSTVATDLAGNATTAALASVNVEPPAPSLSIHLADDTSDGLSITRDDALAGGGDAGAVVSFTIDGALIDQTATADAEGDWTFTPSRLSQGQHTIVASETNGGGTSSASLTFTYETTTPTVSIATPSGIVAFPMETIDGAGEPGTTIQLYDGTQALGSATAVDDNGLWNESVTLSGDGVHTITAADTDGAGNVGGSSAITMFLDTQIAGQPNQNQVASTGGSDHITVDPTNATVDAFGGDDTVSLTPSSDNQPHIITGEGTGNTLDLSGTGGSANVNLGLQTATGAEIGTNQVYNFQNIIGGAGPETLTLSDAPGGGIGSSQAGAGPGSAPGGGGFIRAGSGDDIMTGGFGNDTFEFVSSFGNDTITNFVVSGSNHDIFQVSQSLFANMAALDAALSDAATGVTLTLNAAETVTFTGLTKAALIANQVADLQFV